MGEHWVPRMGGGFTPATDDVIRIRRRIRHNASHIGGGREHSPVVIEVGHLAWQDDAACIGTDPESFFPDGTPENIPLKICAACPVKQICGDYALADPTLKGIWGGMNEKERRRVREKQTRAARREAS